MEYIVNLTLQLVNNEQCTEENTLFLSVNVNLGQGSSTDSRPSNCELMAAGTPVIYKGTVRNWANRTPVYPVGVANPLFKTS